MMCTYMSLTQYMAAGTNAQVSGGSKRFGSITYDQLLPSDPGPTKHLFSSVIFGPPDTPVRALPGVHRRSPKYGSLSSEVSNNFDSVSSDDSGSLSHLDSSPCRLPLHMMGCGPQTLPIREQPRRGSLSSSLDSSCASSEEQSVSSISVQQHTMNVPTALDTVLEITKQAQLIAQSIGQAFQVAYMEFLKANGIDDPGLMKEMDYQEVLNQQEIFGEELFLFSNKDMQKEVITPKLKGEPLGVVIVESGWGSMVPTVVLANMSPSGAAARCGQLNIGDQIMSINGISLVGLPLSTCQNYIKAAKNQTVVKLTVVSCPPVVEVLIKRPDVKYQLGFSVQNGVICSLLRGGIAERGGVRVGHRIIEINGQSVVAVPHEKIVNMLATSVGEIHMKTMPTSIFRLLTGQETPHYM